MITLMCLVCFMMATSFSWFMSKFGYFKTYWTILMWVGIALSIVASLMIIFTV